MSTRELNEPWGRQHKEAIATFVNALGLTMATDFMRVLSGYSGALASLQDEPSKLELLEDLLSHVAAAVGSAKHIEAQRLVDLAAQVDAAFRDGLAIDTDEDDGVTKG